MHSQSATFQQDNAILLALKIVWLTIRRGRALFEDMRKKLSHALLVAKRLEIHVSHETVRLCISVGPLEQHTYIVQTTDVAFADIDHEARIRFILNSDLTIFLFWSYHDARLFNLNFLLIQVRGNFDGCMAIRNTRDGFCYRSYHVFVEVLNIAYRSVFIDNNFSALNDWCS